MSENHAIVRLENIHKAFGSEVVLDGVDLSIEAGRTTVVIGPSGCGKTVLLKHMIGLLRPDKGKVFFRGEEISRLGERQLAPFRKRIGFLFQGGALFDSMTVEQNICFPLQEHLIGTPRERIERCRQVLAVVGMDGMQDKMPEELSGGQRKRVALARAIALEPELVLYDEPTTGLDPIRADLINELILKLKRELNITGVVVTHDMASARKVGDRVVMLHGGRLVADAAAKDLQHVDKDIVQRFVEGRASDDELASLQTKHLTQNKKAGGGKS